PKRAALAEPTPPVRQARSRWARFRDTKRARARRPRPTTGPGRRARVAALALARCSTLGVFGLRTPDAERAPAPRSAEPRRQGAARAATAKGPGRARQPERPSREGAQRWSTTRPPASNP